MSATITSCNRKLADSGSISTTGGLTETVLYQVTVTENNSHPWEVCQATHASMPILGSTHESGSSIVLSKSATREKGSGPQPIKNVWEVAVTYGPLTTSGGNNGPTGETDNSRNIRISVSGIKQTIVTQLTKDDPATAVRNSLKDMYPEGVEVTTYDESITVEFEPKLTANFDMDAVAAARGLINNDVVTMSIPQGGFTLTREFAAHTLLLETADYSITYSSADPTEAAFSVTLVLLYRPDTWDKMLPNKGYRWWVDVGEETKLTDWQDHAEYLDENGYRLGDGEQIVTVGPFQVYADGNLGALLGGI